MAHALKIFPGPALEPLEPKRSGKAKPELEIAVIFTSFELTQAALRSAGVLARELGAGIAVVAAQVVPYPMSLDEPPVPFRFIVKRLAAILSRYPVKTKLRVFLCRDQLEALKRVLNPHSTVVLGVRKTWWPTREKKLARKLRRAGHEVVLVETE